MKLNPSKIREEAKKDFVSTWVKYSDCLPRNTKLQLPKGGKSHPVNDLINKFRSVLIEMGFEEVINKTIIPEKEVYWQYGPEAKIILDRVFYLAKLPRKELGLEKERIQKIKQIIGEFDVKKLQEIFRLYKKGEIESDDLIEEISRRLNKPQHLITSLFESGIFSELLELKPEITSLTLRSHMTASWFSTLQDYQDKRQFPIALFSIGLRYRNEQREDASHLKIHNSASIVIMAPDMSLEAGEDIVKSILEKLGFKNIQFKLKPTSSTYYAYGQEKEVFVEYKNSLWEIGDIGMYSPVALSQYEIKYPVFNAGFGIERIAAIIEGFTDIRELVYHYKFMEPQINDRIIKENLRYIDEPQTEWGEIIAQKIEKVALENKDALGPCKFLVYKDDNVEVYVVEREEGKRLLGPAALNHLNLKDCHIYSTPYPTEYSTGITYLQGIAKRGAKLIEEFLKSDKEEFTYQVKIAKSLPDINVGLDEYIINYLTGHHKKFLVGGPVFITIYAKKVKLQKNG